MERRTVSTSKLRRTKNNNSKRESIQTQSTHRQRNLKGVSVLGHGAENGSKWFTSDRKWFTMWRHRSIQLTCNDLRVWRNSINHCASVYTSITRPMNRKCALTSQQWRWWVIYGLAASTKCIRWHYAQNRSRGCWVEVHSMKLKKDTISLKVSCIWDPCKLVGGSSRFHSSIFWKRFDWTPNCCRQYRDNCINSRKIKPTNRISSAFQLRTDA